MGLSITKGQTFGSTEQVTSTKLHNLVDNATISGLTQSAVSQLGLGTAGMQDGDSKTDIYTVPTGKSCIVTEVIVRSPTASLAGGTSYSFGDGTSADSWKTGVSLATLTSTTDCIVLRNDNSKYTIFDAGDVLGVKPATGATADADAVVEFWGYLY